MIKIQRSTYHANSEAMPVVEVWRTDTSSSEGTLVLVCAIPLDTEDEVVQVEL